MFRVVGFAPDGMTIVEVVPEEAKEGRFITLQDTQGENYIVFLDGHGEGSGGVSAQVAEQMPSGPQGIPISECYNLANLGRRSKVGLVVRHTLDVIDSVHGDGPRQKLLPVKESSGRVHTGGYVYDSRTGEPIEVRLSRYASSPHLTFAHETGHLLAYTRMQQTEDVKAASVELTQAMEQTRAIQKLRGLAKVGMVRIETNIGPRDVPEMRVINYPVDHEFVRYLLRPGEMFARSYAQYIAHRSRDATFLGELIAERTVNEEARVGSMLYPDQWDDDDFVPVAAAMDKLFKVLGWITE
jgi:hypothetical protein